MKNSKQFIFFVFVVLCILSCDNSRVFDKYESIPESEWNVENKVKFDVNINDTASINNIVLNLRNNNSYPYSNIFLFVSITDPEGRYKVDTVEVSLALDNGKWIGKGIGDVFLMKVPLITKVKFEHKGIYTFVFEQAMRDEKLPGILDVGLRIEKIK